MVVSAVDRAPIEVWSNILALAILSPLVPHPDATLAQSLSLFSSQCASEQQTRELAEITGHLRRVCRSWDMLIQQLQPVVVRCNFDSTYIGDAPFSVVPYPFQTNQAGVNITRHELLKAQRLESWWPFKCSCGQECRSSLPHDIMHKISWTDHYFLTSKKDSPYLIPPQDLARVEVLTIADYGGAEWPSNLFHHLPRLTALSWWSEWNRSFIDATIQHDFHRRLTHLKVQLKWADIYNLQHPIVFRRLYFLDLKIMNGSHLDTESGYCDKKPGHVDLVTWAEFPVLRSLSLAVTVTVGAERAETGGEPERKQGEVRSLLKKVGPTLTGLMLHFPGVWGALFTQDMWPFFPSLREFGEFGSKDRYSNPTTILPPPPEDMDPLNILYHLTAYAPIHVRITSESKLFDDFVETCRKWRTRRITMLETWKEAGRLLANSVTERDRCKLPKRIEFYRRVGALGVEICDRDGVHITEKPGVHFLEAVQNFEVRLQGFLAFEPSGGGGS